MTHFKIIVCLVVFLILHINSGKILSGDLALDYANAGQMTKLSFSFML